MVCAEKEPSSLNEKPTVDFSSPIWQKTPIAAMVEANKENDKEPSEPLKILKEKEQVWKIYTSIFFIADEKRCHARCSFRCSLPGKHILGVVKCCFSMLVGEERLTKHCLSVV